MEPKPRIIVVDAHEPPAIGAVTTLREAGFSVTAYGDSFAALVAIEAEVPDLVLLAWTLPYMDGRIVMHALQTGLPHPPPVIALVDGEHAVREAREAGAVSILHRLEDRTRVLRAVDAVLAHPTGRD